MGGEVSRFAEQDSARLAHDTRHDALILFLGRILRPRREPHRRVHTADIKVVLERHGQTMQRADRLARRRKMLVQRLGICQRCLVEDLGETVGLDSASSPLC